MECTVLENEIRKKYYQFRTGYLLSLEFDDDSVAFIDYVKEMGYKSGSAIKRKDRKLLFEKGNIIIYDAKNNKSANGCIPVNFHEIVYESLREFSKTIGMSYQYTARVYHHLLKNNSTQSEINSTFDKIIERRKERVKR